MVDYLRLFLPTSMPHLVLASVGFCLFFAVSLFLYYSINKTLQWPCLLIFSIIFFILSSSPVTLIYLLVAIFIAYIFPILGIKYKSAQKQLCILGVVVIISILAILKYFNFFIINCNISIGILQKLFHLQLNRLHFLSFLAPLGISFYTLILVGYLLDCSNGKIEPESNFFKFMLFSCWWPHMTSGPISRYEQVAPMLFEKREFELNAVCRGIVRMTWGFFQKIVISGHAVLIQKYYLAGVGKYDGFYVWIGMAAGVLQLYSDFNGCMDIVLGASESFGIKLPENFNVPFSSTTVTEFWRRWHITLGRWLHDYVFFPVFGSKLVIRIKNYYIFKKKRKLANKIALYSSSGVVWLCMGLWHGGTWKYIIGNGLWYFIITTLEQELAPLGRKITKILNIKTDCFSWRLFQRFRTFIFFCIGTTFFYASSTKDALRLIKHSLHHFNPLVLFTLSLEDYGMNYLHRWIFVVSVLALFIVDIMKYRLSIKNDDNGLRSVLEKQNLLFRYILYWGMLTLIILSSNLSTQEFLYAQF